MIAKATHQTDERLGPHVEEFRQNRIKNPRYKPSWVEAYDHGKTMAYHEELMAKAHASVDCGPPANAMQYRKFLRKCEYTQGGFKRVNTNRPVHLTLPRVDNVPPGMMPRLSPSELEQQAEDLQGKYSQMLFNTQMLGATNDEVRLMYAKSNRLPVDQHHFQVAAHAAQEATTWCIRPLEAHHEQTAWRGQHLPLRPNKQHVQRVQSERPMVKHTFKRPTSHAAHMEGLTKEQYLHDAAKSI